MHAHQYWQRKTFNGFDQISVSVGMHAMCNHVKAVYHEMLSITELSAVHSVQFGLEIVKWLRTFHSYLCSTEWRRLTSSHCTWHGVFSRVYISSNIDSTYTHTHKHTHTYTSCAQPNVEYTYVPLLVLSTFAASMPSPPQIMLYSSWLSCLCWPWLLLVLY